MQPQRLAHQDPPGGRKPSPAPPRQKQADLAAWPDRHGKRLRLVEWVTSGQERVEALTRQVRDIFPPGGKVDILDFTDEQYEKIVSFRGKGRRDRPEKPDRLSLF
jgi:hypothetical protein